MLPYVWLQIGYAALSLGLIAALWWGAGRLVTAKRALLRGTLTFAGLALLALLAEQVMRATHTKFSSRFAVIALAFYGAAFWLPALVARALVRRDPSSPAHRTPRGIALAFCIAAPLVALWAMFVEPNRLGIREERVAIASWSRAGRAVRLAHLSDLQTVGACKRERRAIEEVRRLAPDLIVITGDYVAGPFFDTRPAEEAARAFLGEIAKIAPTVVVVGHSEGEDVRQRVFAGLGLVYLEDEARVFEFGPVDRGDDRRALRVIGLDPFKPHLALVREPRPAGEALLVATHSPDMTVQLDGARVDLHVAGHTHGGQIVIPGFGPPLTLTRLPREYARGLFRIGDHWMNVCAGLGMEGNHAPRVRLFCPPEICLLVLEGFGGSLPESMR